MIITRHEIEEEDFEGLIARNDDHATGGIKEKIK